MFLFNIYNNKQILCYLWNDIELEANRLGFKNTPKDKICKFNSFKKLRTY